ncbi:MAG: hypothetical protein R3F11_20120 [Verrucomicrobiales bacterium]
MHADHWHFDTSGSWTASRDGKANEFGGGHAHIGMMIYQADQWPEEYRGRLFTWNMHGRRANVERLERHGSGYLGKHQGDVFLAGDDWFRGIDIQQGPDGSAFVLDWSDTGECHDHTGVHRTSGRIYRISYGAPEKPDLSLFADLGRDYDKCSKAVEALVRNPNVWYERQMRKALSYWKTEPPNVQITLRGIQQTEQDPAIRLRAMWGMVATGEFEPRAWLDDKSEYARAFAVSTMAMPYPIDTITSPRDGGIFTMSDDLADQFIAIAKSDPSSAVRLTLASTLQRMPVARRAELGAALAAHEADAGDHNLPSLVWYGLIPVADADPLALVRVAQGTQWPTLVRWIARALATRLDADPEPLDALLGAAAPFDPARRAAVLGGIADGLRGWRKAPPPGAWDAFAGAAAGDGEAAAAAIRDLGALFGDGRALDAIKKVALDGGADSAAREAALKALIEARPGDLRAVCEKLLPAKDLSLAAARGLATFDDPSIGNGSPNSTRASPRRSARRSSKSSSRARRGRRRCSMRSAPARSPPPTCPLSKPARSASWATTL